MRHSVAVALILAAVVVSAYTYTGLRARSGVYLVVKGVQGPATAAIYVEAVAPEGPRPLMAGLYRLDGPTAIPLPTSLLRGLASRWASHRPGTTGYGLIVHMVVIGESGKLTHILDSVTVPLKLLLDDKSLLLEATVAGNGTFKKVEARQPNPLELLSIHPAKNLGRVETMDAHPRQPILPTDNEFTPPLNDNHEPPAKKVCVKDWISFTEVCWDLIVYLTPFNISLMYPDPWFHIKFSDNMLLYVETPIAMFYNEYSYSAIMDLNIGLRVTPQRYELYPSFAPDFGSVLDAVKEGISSVLPDVTLWRGSGATWGGEEYSFAAGGLIYPNQNLTVYIYARPFVTIYKVTIKYPIWLPFITTTKYEAYTLISDVYVTKKNGHYEIPTVTRHEAPPEQIMATFFDGTDLKFGAELKPGDTKWIHDIVDNALTASCSSGTDVNIPVGALGGVLACSALLDIPVADALTAPECLPLIASMGSFSVTLSSQSASFKAIGFIGNRGRVGNVGYNTDEYVFVAVSRLNYRIGDCTAKVPLGLYFDSK